VRPALTFGAAGLLVLGFELATGAFTATFGRLLAGFEALAAGTEPWGGAERFLLGVVVIAAAGVLLVAGAWSRWMEGRIQGRGRSCPRCSRKTRRSPRSVGDRLLGLILEERLTRRTCTECGWRGLSLS